MKRASLIFAGLAFLALLVAQNPKPAEAPKVAPTLSTAEQIAIRSITDKQADFVKQWNDAEQTKLSILREWQSTHPGWHIHYTPQGDPKNFTIEADEKPKPPAPATPAK